MHLTVPGRFMMMVNNVGHAVGAHLTLSWDIADPFAVHITIDAPNHTLEAVTDIQLLHFVISEKVGRLAGGVDGQPVSLRFSNGYFGAKFNLPDGREAYCTSLGEHAAQIANFDMLIVAEVKARLGDIASAVDAELDAMIGDATL